MSNFINITQFTAEDTLPQIHGPYYYLVLLDGEAEFSIDFNHFTCAGKNILFLSPYLFLQWKNYSIKKMHVLQFHGDYYCIAYHKEDVACNGILFNNIYEKPFVSVSADLYAEIFQIFQRIQNLADSAESHDLSISKSYLQLVLALCSKEKQIEIKGSQPGFEHLQNELNFKAQLDQHIDKFKSVAFYAKQNGMAVDTFGKKIKKQYGKPASKLIQERLVLEAKKLLHLSYKSVKEIAAELVFEDEFYFSRYFKKEVGIAPKSFREKVGISIVAKKSM